MRERLPVHQPRDYTDRDRRLPSGLVLLTDQEYAALWKIADTSSGAHVGAGHLRAALREIEAQSQARHQVIDTYVHHTRR